MPEKILVMRYRFIGDTILTIPFLRNLRYAYPDAQIDMLVAPVSGEVIENCPYVNNFIYFDTTRKHRYENSNGEKKTFWNYVKLLREKNYDKAYVLKRSFSSAALAFLAGIKKRIGFDTEGRGFLLTKKVGYSHEKHEIECFFDVLKADGIEVKDDYLENWVDGFAYKKVEERLEKIGSLNKKNVLVHATSGNVNKQWPLEYFAEIVKYLSNKKNVQVLYSGTLKDAETYDKIEKLIDEPLKIQPINLCGEFNLKESLALCRLADLIVGCDSGNLHMAASVKTVVIGIYGPMNPEKWYAWGDNNICLKSNLPCIPCELKKKCPNNRKCLTDIKPAQVIEAIDSKI